MKFIDFPAIGIYIMVAEAECDLPFFTIDLDNFGCHFIHHLEFVFEFGLLVKTSLADVDQPFDSSLQLDEDAEVCNLADLPNCRIANRKSARNLVVPWIVLELLIPERQSLLFLINPQDHGLYLLSLLEEFRGMLDVFGPRHVGNVNQSVDTLFKSDECAKVGKTLDLSFDTRADCVFSFHHIPGVRSSLLHAERDLSAGGIHVEYCRFNLIPDGYDS